MTFTERLSDPGWLLTALTLLAMLLLIALLRLREAGKIYRKFPRERILRISYLATYYGLDSQPAGPLRFAGAAVLLKDGFYFRSRVTGFELHIPAKQVLNVWPADTHRGRTMRQYVVAIRFRTPEGRGETAAFRFVQIGTWFKALRETLTGLPT